MATIYCFTSTGNSLYAAKKIADKIGGKVLPMRGEQTVCGDDMVGFVFPCYFWGLPRMANRFIAQLRITNKNAYVFAVMTCGGPVFGVMGFLKQALRMKDIKLSYSARIIAVTNYLPEYNVKQSEAQRQKNDAQIVQIADEVMDRKIIRRPSSALINRLIYKAFPDGNSDRHFSIAPSCTGCETCRKICPADNIVMKAGKPVFQHRCEHCLGCLHNCPATAIDWKEKTQGKERYRNPGVSLGELVEFNGGQV
jgi:ferredoxin